jgi:hypothetical protein
VESDVTNLISFNIRNRQLLANLRMRLHLTTGWRYCRRIGSFSEFTNSKHWIALDVDPQTREVNRIRLEAEDSSAVTIANLSLLAAHVIKEINPHFHHQMEVPLLTKLLAQGDELQLGEQTSYTREEVVIDIRYVLVRSDDGAITFTISRTGRQRPR